MILYLTCTQLISWVHVNIRVLTLIKFELIRRWSSLGCFGLQNPFSGLVYIGLCYFSLASPFLAPKRLYYLHKTHSFSFMDLPLTQTPPDCTLLWSQSVLNKLAFLSHCNPSSYLTVTNRTTGLQKRYGVNWRLPDDNKEERTTNRQ